MENSVGPEAFIRPALGDSLLLPRRPPERFAAWNRTWGAPFGRTARWARVGRRVLDRWGAGHSDLALRAGGPFSIQGNNDTRVVEYPWVYFEASPARGLDIVEIGGALSGFQFVLSKSGCKVTNVDPGEQDQAYWELAVRLNGATMQRLNRLFGTTVELRGCSLKEAELPAASVDRVISISTIEHISPDQLPDLAREIARILRPGGLCILTIDLFLDLVPFTDKEENVYGRNIDVRSLVEASGLRLVKGDTSQLVGFDDCDPIGILRDLGEYFIGTGYPVCAQALVLEKR